jgi:hypothetical protein
MSAPIKAEVKFVISKPLTMLLANQNISAFIIKVKSPRVRIFIGSVSKRISGLISAFNNPRTSEAMRADQKEVNSIPGVSLATKISMSVFKSQRSKSILSPVIFYLFSSLR